MDSKSKNNYYLQDANRPLDLYPVINLFIFGSDLDSDIVMNSESHFKVHVKIERRTHNYFIRVINPEIKTFINGTSIIEAQFNVNDRLNVGNRTFIFTKFPEYETNKVKLYSKNKKWNKQLQNIGSIAQSELPVIIQGPSGVGKEIISKEIHSLSKRKNGPLVSVNCSALSENLIESELFGHKKGSFTDAREDRLGAFEASRGGTLFLDEIGDLPLNLQPKLLRALENKEIRPLGCDNSVITDVRIIAATHQNLYKKVIDGSFRQDLYFRLNILRVTPPPLRDRLDDFDSLLTHFCKEHKVSFSSRSIERLKKHSWPGNIRELKNVISRAAALVADRNVKLTDLPTLMDINYNAEIDHVDMSSLNVETLKLLEKQMIVSALVSSMGNQRIAAEKLGMARTTINDRIRSYKIDLRSVIQKSLIHSA